MMRGTKAEDKKLTLAKQLLRYSKASTLEKLLNEKDITLE